ncbi:Hypothetical predicted protein, partial [Olea europaea subsp. europaea]
VNFFKVTGPTALRPHTPETPPPTWPYELVYTMLGPFSGVWGRSAMGPVTLKKFTLQT